MIYVEENETRRRTVVTCPDFFVVSVVFLHVPYSSPREGRLSIDMP